MNELARKDLFVCLGIWVALEVICFAVLPASPFGQSRASLQGWFLASLLVGFGGVVLMAGSTQMQEFFQTQNFFRQNSLLKALVVSLVSWLGLLGIGFPLLVISLQIFAQIFGLLKN